MAWDFPGVDEHCLKDIGPTSTNELAQNTPMITIRSHNVLLTVDEKIDWNLSNIVKDYKQEAIFFSYNNRVFDKILES